MGKALFISSALALVVTVLLTVKCNHATDNTAESYTDAARLKSVQDLLVSMDRPVEFYGQVIDSNGNPVFQAAININITTAIGVKKIVVSTNENGMFEVKNEKGSSVFIDKISRTGYDYSRKYSGTKIDYSNDGSFMPDKNKPVVFKMRKKEPPTLIIPGDISVVFAKNVTNYEVDLVEMADEKPFGLSKYHGTSAHIDLKTRIEYSGTTDSYLYVFETPDPDSGIIEMNEMLYVPPEKIYKTPYKITVPNGKKVETYLYVKSRGGNVYSRLKIKLWTL